MKITLENNKTEVIKVTVSRIFCCRPNNQINMAPIVGIRRDAIMILFGLTTSPNMLR